MIEHLTFQSDAALIDRLGRELVAKQTTALVELVKNGFDADATALVVAFGGQGGDEYVEIRDDGLGMNREEVIDGFLRIASDEKVRSPRSPYYNRQRAGRKGIGRFAAQRLGRRLILTTQRREQEQAYRLYVDWDRFQRGLALEDITVELSEVPAKTSGTTVRIEGLRDAWSEAQIRRCWRQVVALQQPFPVAPTESDESVDPGFSVRFVRNDELLQHEHVIADMHTEILDHLHATIDMHVDNEGQARWKLSKNRFGPTTEWTPIHHEDRESTEVRAYDNLRNIWMKAHHVILRPELLPSLVYTRVRDVLSEEGGIRLYRNGFRVVPYGEPEDDWLGLDEAYAKRSVLAPIANRNFFGVIEIQDPKGLEFEEHTSREGLIETPGFIELKKLASSVLITAAMSISRERGKKSKAGTNTAEDRDDSLDNLFDELADTASSAQRAVQRVASGASAQDVEDAAKKTEAIQEAIVRKRETWRSAKEKLADEAAMLRFLATLGMTMAEFSHETGMTFDAVRIDFQKIFEVALESRPNDAGFSEKIQRTQDMLQRLDALTSYLNSLASARAARDMAPISMSRVAKDFERAMRSHAETQSVTLDVDTPAFDPLYTKPIHEAEIASVLLNFHTNALKAMKRSGNERRILLIVDRSDEPEGMIRLRFADTGDGIPESKQTQVFDAFFTTRTAPSSDASDVEHTSGSGLGLWIVYRIAANVGGRVDVVDAPEGYATCFELLLPSEET